MRAIITRLLHLANSSPPWMFKREFYAIKERLLKRYGTPDGCDVQHIPGRQCWTCGGTGMWDKYEYCRKCDGTGWYKSPKWICLDRWRFGEHTFHVPGAVSYTKPDPDITRITGYVEHRSYGRRSDEAFAWLCLLCGEWRLLWRWLNASYYVLLPWYPMLTLQWATHIVSEYIRSAARQCCDCGKRIGKTDSNRCDKCHAAAFRREAHEDIPF